MQQHFQMHLQIVLYQELILRFKVFKLETII